MCMLNLPVEQHTGNDMVTMQGAISFKNVLFRYQLDTPPALDNLSLDIQAGETLGVVGIGSGKSTLARLFLRLCNPERLITVDGTRSIKLVFSNCVNKSASCCKKTIYLTKAFAKYFNRAYGKQT